MEFEQFLADYGYGALFAAFCLGLIGLPVPNEVLVMTSGAAVSEGTLRLVPAFLSAYAGICCGLTVGYAVGRLIGKPLLRWIVAKERWTKQIKQTEQLIKKYGTAALLFSYFIPVVRNLMPYVIGASSAPFTKFAFYAFSGAFVWTAVFFSVGYAAGTAALESLQN